MIAVTIPIRDINAGLTGSWIVLPVFTTSSNPVKRNTMPASTEANPMKSSLGKSTIGVHLLDASMR